VRKYGTAPVERGKILDPKWNLSEICEVNVRDLEFEINRGGVKGGGERNWSAPRRPAVGGESALVRFVVL